MARLATAGVVRGGRVTRRLGKALKSGLAIVWKNREKVKTYGIEVTRHAARGAIHAADEKTVDVEQLAGSVMEGVVEVSSQAGVEPEDAVLGASQGIIQGAAETGADLGTVTHETIEAAKAVAEQVGLSEEEAAAEAAEGALQAAEAIGPKAVAEVAEALPEELLESISTKEGEDRKEADTGS